LHRFPKALGGVATEEIQAWKPLQKAAASTCFELAKVLVSCYQFQAVNMPGGLGRLHLEKDR